MKPKPFRVGLTWWVGWVVTLPIRLPLMLIFTTIAVCIPAWFYGIANYVDEIDQSKWKL